MTEAAHILQVFGDDRRLVDAVTRFMREGIESGATCVVIATPEHRRQIEAGLREAGSDPATLAAQYRYICLDAATMLSTFSVDGRPDRARFHKNLGLLIRQAASRGQPVRIFGEMVNNLAANGAHIAAAFQLEELWNELSRQHTFTLFCAYPHSCLTDEPRNRRLLHALHSHTLPADD
jgi:hypothetical protein